MAQNPLDEPPIANDAVTITLKYVIILGIVFVGLGAAAYHLLGPYIKRADPLQPKATAEGQPDRLQGKRIGYTEDDLRKEPEIPQKNGHLPQSTPVPDAGTDEWKRRLAQSQAQAQVPRQPAPAPVQAARPTTPSAPKPKGRQARVVMTTGIGKLPPAEGDRGPTEGRYVLKATTKIDCALESAVNSEIPGLLPCVVISTVYDSKTMQVPLIPQYAVLQVVIDQAPLRFGDRRIKAAAKKLIFPDTTEIELSAPGVDQMGRTGWTGQIDTKLGTIFWGWLMKSAFNAPATLAQSAATQIPGAGQAISTVASDAAMLGTKQAETLTNTSPVITKDGGERVQFELETSLSLPRYH